MNHEKQLSAEEFDRRFEAGKVISAHADWAAARRPNKQNQRVNVDFPTWMVEALDTEARHLGVSRQALVKVWIANCLARDSHVLSAFIQHPCLLPDNPYHLHLQT